MAVVARSSAPVTFWVLPGLMVPTLNFGESARAASSASFSVRHGESAFTSKILGDDANSVIYRVAYTGVLGSYAQYAAVPAARTLLSFGGDVVVLSPPAVRDDLRAVAAEVTAIYPSS